MYAKLGFNGLIHEPSKNEATTVDGGKIAINNPVSESFAKVKFSINNNINFDSKKRTESTGSQSSNGISSYEINLLQKNTKVNKTTV